MLKGKRMILGMAFFAVAAMVVIAWAAGAVQLPMTGQTTSYATGDDGGLQRGVAWPSPRFTDNGDGTVTDEVTGLMWLKDGNCFGIGQWFNGAANYPALETVRDFNSNPGNYSCTDYTASYNDWRLPNVNELESLVNAEESSTTIWLNAQEFTNVQSGNYWSSTTRASATDNVWGVDMGSGSVVAVNKANSIYLWPVRAGQ